MLCGRMTPKISKIILVVVLILCTDCTTVQKLYPLPEQGVEVKGNKLYNNGTVFAELRFLLTDKERHSHRGFALYYYQYGKEVWIYPSSGWHYFSGGKKYTSVKDIEQAWLNQKDDDIVFYEGDRIVNSVKLYKPCFDVHISKDGKYIYYKTPGFFFDSSYKYLVEYGISK